ncbi:hypothetical protein ATK74_1124 [Propionicimonas paludicola]|uniref:Uncharacterized protein n=1 Tax=Propionicimonas paludicola TaxID=185243 RepID=A0A2A9CQ44_9ACTN|nr:hypothetical protein [Propionicimonas paludicola]PFG16577.1 hypothetical protein ATK74_1124 [Propionicimonas paludicola]
MAEIRKYDPSKGNAIAEALRAAMGDPIRPATPGQTASDKPSEPEPAATPAWISLSLVTKDETEAE